jgi:hypothetical protein
MPATLRIAALVLFLALLGWWTAAGMNPGWTKTSVATMETDPVTEIEYPVWKKQFVPGVDLLAAGTGCAAALVALSFLPLLNRNPKAHTPS